MSAVSSQIGVLQATCHPTKFDIINDVKLFLTVYHIFCNKFLTLTNQMLCYIIGALECLLYYWDFKNTSADNKADDFSEFFT